MKKVYLFTFLLVVTILTGCSKSEPTPGESAPVIVVLPSGQFTLDAAAGSSAVATISSNRSWTTAINYEGVETGWLTLTPANGDAGNDMEMTITATTTSESSARTATVTINYGGKEKSITVKQLAP